MPQDDSPDEAPIARPRRITEAERREAERKRRLADALRQNLRRRKSMDEPDRPDDPVGDPADRER